MANNNGVTKVRVETVSAGGGLWFVGWLFTIGFAKLTIGEAIVAIIAWPYYLGVAVR